MPVNMCNQRSEVIVLQFMYDWYRRIMVPKFVNFTLCDVNFLLTFNE